MSSSGQGWREGGVKLLRGTLSINSNRPRPVLAQFKAFQKLVHLCSFRSFHEPRQKFRCFTTLSHWCYHPSTLENRFQVIPGQIRPKKGGLNFVSSWFQKFGYYYTLEAKMEHCPCGISEEARLVKLLRDTLSVNSNRPRPVLAQFKAFQNLVHFCSFRSFHEPQQ